MIGREIALAWRRLRATPVFTIVSALTLAVGIAAVTTVYALIRAVAAPPAGVADVDQLLTLSHSEYGSGPLVTFSSPDFEDLRRRQTTMSHVAAFEMIRAAIVVNGQTHQGITEAVTGNYFETVGVIPVVGRLIQPGDDQPGAEPVVVLGFDLWQHAFGGRPDVVGRTVLMGGGLFEVIGVTPRPFAGVLNNGLLRVMAWIPRSTLVAFDHYLDSAALGNDRNARRLAVRARPKPGVSVERVAAEVRAIAAQLDREVPIGTHIADRRFRSAVHASRLWVTRRTRDVLLNETVAYFGPSVLAALMAAAVVVLLICCSNLANLMVARGAERRYELALRLALGATRRQIVTGFMAEVLIVTAIGVVLAVGLIRLALTQLSAPFAVGRNAMAALTVDMDLQVVGVGLLSVLGALVVGGVLPGLVLTARGSHIELISGIAPTVTPRWRMRRVLIGAQVIASVALLGIAALFLARTVEITRPPDGADLDPLALVEVDLRLQNYDDHRSLDLISRTVARLEGHPGIERAAASEGLPFGLTSAGAFVHHGSSTVPTQMVAVTPGFFEAMGIPLVDGVGLDAPEARDGMPAVVVDTDLARMIFGRVEVVGQQIAFQRQRGRELPPIETRTIVGVAEARSRQTPGRPHAIYVPFDSLPRLPVVFMARTSGDPERMATEIRAALGAVDPSLGTTAMGTARQVIYADADNYPSKLLFPASLILGGLGLVVVLAGLYGVLSHLVARRTREVGLRLALGARGRQVLLRVIREGLTPVAIGVALGGWAALRMRQLVTNFMFGPPVSGDLVFMGIVPILILASALVACYVPARRASRIDPARALKEN